MPEKIVQINEYAGRDGAIRPEQWCTQNGQMVQVHRMNGA